jgi:hypothetical protein
MNWRSSAVVLAALLAPLPAAAQGWQVYSYRDIGFSVQFPAPPKVSQGDYLTTSGTTIPATLVSLKQDKLTYTVMVVDYSKAGPNQNPIDEAVRTATLAGAVKTDVQARIGGRYGRELTVDDHDGGRSIYAIFFFDNRLYELNAKASPPDAASGSGALIRFQQSLQF